MVLQDLLRNKSILKRSPSGEEYRSIKLDEIKEISAQLKIPQSLVEIGALEDGIIPERYERNIGSVGLKGQILLLKSKVAVIGAGGLGGFVVELLARVGVGHLVVVDGDSFEENNLNRQLLSSEEFLGMSKSDRAADRVARINSSVSVTARTCYVSPENAGDIIHGCNVVVDALDNVKSRFVLEDACRAAGIPMVHGAIGGFFGQVMTIYPEDRGLELLYGPREKALNKGIEVSLGNPSATPPMVASWQAQEVVKVITGIGSPLRNRVLYMDAKEGDVHIIKFQKNKEDV